MTVVEYKKLIWSYTIFFQKLFSKTILHSMRHLLSFLKMIKFDFNLLYIGFQITRQDLIYELSLDLS